MSWQATAWAEKQKVGSSSLKLTLLVLANYANEDGWCWPAQRTIATGAEQSVDTVQRNIRSLMKAGFIAEKRFRQRFGGHWPSFAYRLNLPITGPQNAARSESMTGSEGLSTGPQALRPGRAAPRPSIGPQALRHEPIKEISIATLKRPGAKRDRVEVIQHRIAHRLGNGDAGQGWVIFSSLAPHVRVALEQHERAGTLTDQSIGLAKAHLAIDEFSK